ncbi:MAG: protein phosphatase 2C domain-containing protein [Anaerolineaceae bacterium]
MREILEFNFDAKSHMGRKPRNNEDYVAFHVPAKEKDRIEQGCLFIVADGVGGAEAGEYVSKYASEKVIFEYFKQTSLPFGERLIAAIQKVNRDIFTHALDYAPEGGMATTLVAALLLNNKLYIANVGDSRAYLLNKKGIKQISSDHNLVGEMVSQGVMSEEAARNTNTKNQLTRSIGGELDVKVDFFGPLPIKKSDRILLCTDGLTRYATQGDLIGLAGSGKLADDVIKMISFAIESGGEDNVSMILIEAVEKSTTTLKSPIKHIGRSQVFEPPESKLGGGITTRRKGTPWAVILVAGLAVMSFTGWFIWNSTNKNTESAVNIPLSTLPDPDQTPGFQPIVDEPIPVTEVEYLPEDIRAIDISPDGLLAVVGTDQNGISMVRLKNKIVFQNIPTAGVTGVAFIDNQTFIFTSKDGSIHVRGGKTWAELISIKGYSAAINAVVYSPAAELVATASEDNKVTLWNPITDPGSLEIIGYTKLTELKHSSAVKSIAFSSDGKTLLTGSEDGSVMEWDLDGYEGIAALNNLASPVISVAYSIVGKCIAAGSMKGEIYSVCRNQGVIGGEYIITKHESAITGLAFSPMDANLLASGSTDKTIKIWRNFYELVADINQGSAIDRLIFTPDGKHLIVAWSNNGVNTLTIWTIPYQQRETPVVYPVLTATPTPSP